MATWLNIAGMFYQDHIDISDYIYFDQNILAVKGLSGGCTSTIKSKVKTIRH